jgi:hypothetical protein
MIMIRIITLDGQTVDLDEAAIVLIAGPYPHDVGPHTYVYGMAPGPLLTAEDPKALAARLGVSPPLASLTRPDGTPVWIKGAAATMVRAPLPPELQAPGEVNAVVLAGALRQSVRETIAAARAILDAHGGNV